MKAARVVCLALAVLATACGTDDPDPGVDPPGPDADVALTGLDGCFAGGGALSETATIDNNVVVAHGQIRAMAFSATGQMALASTDGAIKLWSIHGDAQGTLAPEVGYDAAFGEGNPPIGALAYAPDGSWIASGRENAVVNLWSATTGEILATTALGEAPIVSVAVASDGDRVAVADASFAGNIRVWSRSDETATEPLATALWGATTVRFLPNGLLVTAGDNYGQPWVELHDADDPSQVLWSWVPFDAFTGSARDVAVSADGSFMVAVGAGFVSVLDLTAAEPATLFQAEVATELMSVALTPGEGHFVTTDLAGAVRVWATDGTDAADQMTRDGLLGVRSGGDYEQLVTADASGIIRMLGCE